MSEPTIALPFSVVIATRHRARELETCLAAVSKLRPAASEIIVVDNTSGDPATQSLATHFSARYIVVPSPGLSRARNAGARAANREFVAFVDDDAVPESSWLGGLYAAFQVARVAGVAGRIAPTRVQTEAEILASRMGVFEGAGAEGRIVDSNTDSWFEIANFGGIGNGANLAIRRSTYDWWRGFDERLGRGGVLSTCEENLAFCDLVAAGWRVAYTPDAVVRHPFAADMHSLRRRYVQERTMHVAYMTLLWFERPRYRRELLAYVSTAQRGRRPWRPPMASSVPRLASRWRLLLAYLSGPLVYARTRLRPVFSGHKTDAVCAPVESAGKR